MPYFGVWCTNTNSPNSFCSTGSYKIFEQISEHHFKLIIRDDQPTFNKKSPKYLNIKIENLSTNSISSLIDRNENFFIKYIKDSCQNLLNDFDLSKIESMPHISQGIVLHPNSTFFKNRNNVKVFKERLNSFLAKYTQNFQINKNLFLDEKIDILDNKNKNLDNKFNLTSNKIKIAFQYTPDNETFNIFWKNLFNSVFYDINYEILLPSKKDLNWNKSIFNNSEIDLRTYFVYPGTTHNLSIIKMMFCSNLGISFPDYNNSICNLVTTYENQELDEQFKINFNKVFLNSSLVYPLFNSQDVWLISKTINLNSVPSSIIYPRFENIRLVE